MTRPLTHCRDTSCSICGWAAHLHSHPKNWIIRPNWGVRMSHFVTKILWLTVKHITHKCIYAALYLKIYLHHLKLWVRDSKVVGSCEVTTGLSGPPQLHSAGAEISGNNSVVLHAFCHRKFRKKFCMYQSISVTDMWNIKHSLQFCNCKLHHQSEAKQCVTLRIFIIHVLNE